MKEPIRILHLEDDPNDAELIAMKLQSDELSCVIECVKSEKEFSVALERGGFDLILADNTGPTFSGYTALAMAKKAHPTIQHFYRRLGIGRLQRRHPRDPERRFRLCS